MLNIVLLGAPGVGKGVQSQLLEKQYRLDTIAPGHLFRAAIKAKTPLGLQMQRYIEAGNLAPNKVVIEVVGKKLKAAYQKNQRLRGFLFDGCPRSLAQAKALEAQLAAIKTQISLIIVLEVDSAELNKRLTQRHQMEQRADDQATQRAHRLSLYKSYASPIIAYYQNSYPTISINGKGTIEEVNKRITTTIEAYLAEKKYNGRS